MPPIADTHDNLPPDAHLMQCMEVWGGNRAVDNGVVMPGLDAWVFSRPFTEGPGRADAADVGGGGDVHYVTSCATGRITRLIVADVSGHGPVVARAGEDLRRLMRKFSNYVDQSRFVEALNERFLDAAAPDAAPLFATAVVATYFAPTDELSVALAGHPRPMLYDSRSGAWSVLRPEGRKGKAGPSSLPLGVVEGTSYPSSSLSLRRGDLVLFYTDALVEARGPGGAMIGESGLLALLSSLDASRPEGFIRELIERLRGRGEASDWDDDVTCLLVRRNDLKPRPSPALGIMATLRIVRHAAASLLPGALPASLPEFNARSLLGGVLDRFNRRGADDERSSS